MNPVDKRTLVRNLILLFIIIAASAVLVRFLSSGETLAEYAQENNIPLYSEESGTQNENEPDGN